MGAIALRSPVYVKDNAGTGANSAKLTITIDGTLQYTLVKEITGGSVMLWDISELCLDFLQYDSALPNPALERILIVSTLTSHVSTNGTGAVLTTQTYTDYGYDSYSLFQEGNLPLPYPGTSVPTWLVAPDPEGTLNNEYYIYVPVGEAGQVPFITTSFTNGYNNFSSSATEISGTSAGTKMNIIRVDCTKYGVGHKVVFVNKYGAKQELWFFLKIVNGTSKKQEQFQRNILNTTGASAGTYSQSNHTRQVYNTMANESITLSSGYYPEWTNQWFEQLLLSKQVWIYRLLEDSSTVFGATPVNVKTSDFKKKTVLNNKLIDYTFEFELSANYINNIR